MKFVTIYGAPGVGKLTTANELAKLTGFTVIHLHQVIDLIDSVFGVGTNGFAWDEPYCDLRRSMRMSLIETAIKAKLPGVIFTYGYATDAAGDFIKKLLPFLQENNVETHFVYLQCDRQELFKRVASPSRKDTGKLQDPSVLEEVLQTMPFNKMPFVDSLVIDNTNLSPIQVATRIRDECNL